jgi:hypothetical protein
MVLSITVSTVARSDISHTLTSLFVIENMTDLVVFHSIKRSPNFLSQNQEVDGRIT